MMFFNSINCVRSSSKIPTSTASLLIILLLATETLARLDSLNLDETGNINKVSYIPSSVRTRRDTDQNSSSSAVPINNSTDSLQPTSGPTKSATTRVPDSTATSLLSTSSAHFDVRDVTYFLESHPAHSVYDPRIYFTEERTSRSLAILLNEIKQVPSRLRFAFLTRVFNELGRKIASKLNYYSTEVAAILRKTPDDLGNKPEVSMLVEAVKNAFESKEDMDPKQEADEQLLQEDSISKLIDSDREKLAVFNSSLAETANYFAHIISYFAVGASKKFIRIPGDKRESVATVLGEALQMGCKTFIDELSSNDKFRITDETLEYAQRVLNMTITIFKRHVKDNDDTVEDSIKSNFKVTGSFEALNPISDKTGLIGPWNSYLFTNLGSAERVIKLFAGLLTRVPAEVKSRWINMYIDQVYNEMERTLSGFVVMQGMPYNNNASEIFLLDPERSVNIMPVKLPKPRTNYLADRNRIPARCYLAGRRWRLVLTRALKGYPHREDVIKAFADKMGQFKVRLVRKSGNEIYRLCMPRLEVGIRGWGINGDPQVGSTKSNNFPLRNPLDNLLEMDNPFVSGVKLGYKFGVKIGYNEERNATLEIERTSNLNKKNAKERIESETKYLAKASYRHASTISARGAFQLAIREGYLTTLKVSARSGIQIPSEAGSQVASLKCVSFAGQVGMDAGRTVVENFLVDRKVSDRIRESLIKVGEIHGLLAGEITGKTIGAIVGKEAAEQAYRSGIIRGGKVSRAKFHLDEFQAGAKLGFEYGLKEGKRIASSSQLDPSAPRAFRFAMPVFSEKDKVDVDVDHWEKDLIPPLTSQTIFDLQMARNQTTVTGNLKGVYRVAKEVKKGFKRVSYTNLTYNLEVYADGFIMNDVAYLRLNGTVNKMGNLRGSLVARDIFNDIDL